MSRRSKIATRAARGAALGKPQSPLALLRSQASAFAASLAAAEDGLESALGLSPEELAMPWSALGEDSAAKSLRAAALLDSDLRAQAKAATDAAVGKLLSGNLAFVDNALAQMESDGTLGAWIEAFDLRHRWEPFPANPSESIGSATLLAEAMSASGWRRAAWDPSSLWELRDELASLLGLDPLRVHVHPIHADLRRQELLAEDLASVALASRWAARMFELPTQAERDEAMAALLGGEAAWRAEPSDDFADLEWIGIRAFVLAPPGFDRHAGLAESGWPAAELPLWAGLPDIVNAAIGGCAMSISIGHEADGGFFLLRRAETAAGALRSCAELDIEEAIDRLRDAFGDPAAASAPAIHLDASMLLAANDGEEGAWPLILASVCHPGGDGGSDVGLAFRCHGGEHARQLFEALGSWAHGSLLDAGLDEALLEVSHARQGGFFDEDGDILFATPRGFEPLIEDIPFFG